MTQEILVAGTLSKKKLAELVKTYQTRFDVPMLALMETFPHHPVTPEERQNLLHFAPLRSDTNITPYTTGRIFHEQGELRWESQKDTADIIYTGNAVYLPDFQYYKRCILANYERVIRTYFLFGKRLRSDQITNIGPAVQEGDFVELRISRLLRYPRLSSLAQAERIQLAVYEYIDSQTALNIAHRFHSLVPFQKQES